MLKRIYSILVCLLLLSAILISASATEAEEEPVVQITKIEISTAEEFLEFAENCRLDSFSKNLHVYLKKDIDLTGYDFEGIPIFSGTFWGMRRCISGLSITSDGSNLGLFRYLTEDAVVRELNVSGQVQPGGSRGNVGAVVGTNGGEIRNCNFEGTVSGSDCVGGIAGENTVTGVIENCTVTGEIHGNHFVGGIAGQNYGVIRKSKNEALINTTPQQNEVEIADISLESLTNSESANTVTDIGGIAGISSGVIRESENYGGVGYRQMGYNIGGIAGTQSGYIVNCQNYGDIQGRKEVGGIVGQMEPVTVIAFTEDTLQILKGQLNTMSGLVNQASGNAQSNANQIVGKIAVLQDQAQTAKDAVETLFFNDSSSGRPDMDTILAAQSTLTKTMESMPGTMRSIASAAQATVSGLSKDLNAISGQISAMGNTLNNASENLGGTITDISDQDTPELLTGKVENCVNSGAILADLNVGGIAGAMAMENDLDVWEDVQQLGDTSLNFNSEVRVVILDCENSGTVTGKKQNAGGIVGWQSLGLVKASMNTGSVDATGGNYAGGISGTGTGYIRNCFANCEVSANSYLGGIAGSGTIVSDSIAHVKLIGGKERIGSILGWADAPLAETQDPIRNNYYLVIGTDLGAVDGVSYDNQAQPLEQDAFIELPELPDAFKTATVSFCFEDGTVQQVQLPVGSCLLDSQIPEIPYKEGFRSKWAGLEDVDVSNIAFDMSFTVESTAYATTIASEQTRSDGRPLLLMEGSFHYNDVVSISGLDAELSLREDLLVTEVWEITAPQSATQARFLLPDPSTTEALHLYACGEDGLWKEITTHRNGSYLVFAVDDQQMQIALAQEQQDLTIWFIAGGAILLASAVVVAVVIRKKKRKHTIVEQA